jgi:hypothetical protein
MQRIRSPSASKRKRALAEYKRLANQLIREEPKHAANALAFVAQTATQRALLLPAAGLQKVSSGVELNKATATQVAGNDQP